MKWLYNFCPTSPLIFTTLGLALSRCCPLAAEPVDISRGLPECECVWFTGLAALPEGGHNHSHPSSSAQNRHCYYSLVAGPCLEWEATAYRGPGPCSHRGAVAASGTP